MKKRSGREKRQRERGREREKILPKKRGGGSKGKFE